MYGTCVPMAVAQCIKGSAACRTPALPNCFAMIFVLSIIYCCVLTFGEGSNEVEGQPITISSILIHHSNVSVAPFVQQVCSCLPLEPVRGHCPEEEVGTRQGRAGCCWADQGQLVAG